MFIFRIIVCLVLVIASSSSFAESKIETLAKEPQWLKLLHYAPTYFGGSQSLVDDAKFFLSEEGDTDPLGELKKTIELLYSEKPDKDKYCRFQARALWLNKVYKPLLKKHKCERFKEWIEAINTDAVSLVFPASFINNPASAFGHTFLKLDAPNKNNTAAYAINFAAATQGENAILYALKGVFGGYGGYFSIGPYYERLKKYNDLENRDMWEFGLNFIQAEIDLMLAHVWEMREVSSSYYYFDEKLFLSFIGATRCSEACA